MWVCVCGCGCVQNQAKENPDICLGKACAQHIQSECLATQVDGNACTDLVSVHLFIGTDDRTLYFPSVLLIKAL